MWLQGTLSQNIWVKALSQVWSKEKSSDLHYNIYHASTVQQFSPGLKINSSAWWPVGPVSLNS